MQHDIIEYVKVSNTNSVTLDSHMRNGGMIVLKFKTKPSIRIKPMVTKIGFISINLF